MDKQRRRARTRALVAAMLVCLTASACSSKGSHVEILASVKADARGSAWDLETNAYRALGKALFGPGQRVVATPLSDLSTTEASIFDQSIAPDSLLGDNPMQLKERADKIRTEYDGAIKQLETRRDGRARTEIISAVVGSAARFRDDATGTDKVIVILSSGFEQSGILNMGDVTLNLRSATPSIMESLHHRDLVPDLKGVKVCMAGITSGENRWADTNATLAIKKFWDAYFEAAGARLIGFSPTLSATCLQAVHRADLFATH